MKKSGCDGVQAGVVRDARRLHGPPRLCPYRSDGGVAEVDRCFHEGQVPDQITASVTLTRHEVQQSGCDGVQAGAVRDVGARVPQHGDHAVCHGPALAGQVVAEAVRRLHEGRQHDRLVRQLHCAENLRKTKAL